MIKKYCKKCDRELAEVYEECPFCKGDLEVREVEEHVETEEERTRRLADVRLARIKQKQQKKLLGMVLVILILLGTASQMRIGDVEVKLHAESFLTRTYNFHNAEPVPEAGLINSKDDLEEFLKVYGLEFSCPVDLRDFTLLYRANLVRSNEDSCFFIEKVTQNPVKTWALIARAKPSGSVLSTVNDLGEGTMKVQSIQLVAIPKTDTLPTQEHLEEPFSRLSD